MTLYRYLFKLVFSSPDMHAEVGVLVACSPAFRGSAWCGGERVSGHVRPLVGGHRHDSQTSLISDLWAQSCRGLIGTVP